MLKYTIMKVRCKISYEAFKRSMTVSELFMQTILYSLGKITLTDSLTKGKSLIYPTETIEMFEDFLNSNLSNVFKRVKKMKVIDQVKKTRMIHNLVLSSVARMF